MKVGDNFTVTLAGFDVAYGVVESIEDGKATILIPATRVVMGVKQSLTDLAPETDRVLVDNVTQNAPAPAEVSPAAQQVSQEAHNGAQQAPVNNVGAPAPVANPEPVQPVATQPVYVPPAQTSVATQSAAQPTPVYRAPDDVSNEGLRNAALDSSVLD